MATPIRKKRNFKELQLNVGGNAPASSVTAAPKDANAPKEETVGISMRTAPTATGPGLKKRPPPFTLKAPKVNSSSGMVSAIEPSASSVLGGADGQNGANGSAGASGNLLVVSSGPSSAPLTATNNNVNVKRNTLHQTITTTLANLEATSTAEVKYDLKNEDFRDIQDLGQGNGGSVKKAEHIPTGTFMAKKVRSLVGSGGNRFSSLVSYLFSRPFSSMPNPTSESRSYENFKSCTNAIRNTSFHSMARFSPIPISASAWNSRTRGPWMASTRKLGLSTSTS